MCLESGRRTADRNLPPLPCPVRFLTTSGVAAALEDLTRDARRQLVLVTPYLQLSANFADRLADANARGVQITLLYGKDKLAPAQRKTLETLDRLTLHYYEHLHAKCYYNESRLVISSMNLYEYSEKNNREMGVLVEAGTDVYRQAVEESESIMRAGDEKPTRAKGKQARKPRTKEAEPSADDRGLLAKVADRVKKATAPTGHCLRCGTDVRLDPEAPYCKKCFGSWVRFKNPTYEEAHCHACGKDHKSSLKKPVCLPCYRKLAA